MTHLHRACAAVFPPLPPVTTQWSIPSNIEISSECRDLLTRMLVRDPDERITMAQIHQHPWFIANLPMEVRERQRKLAEDPFGDVVQQRGSRLQNAPLAYCVLGVLAALPANDDTPWCWLCSQCSCVCAVAVPVVLSACLSLSLCPLLCMQAVSMNDSYLNDEDYSGVQSEEDIKRILKDAQTPGPNKYNFDNAGQEVRNRAGARQLVAVEVYVCSGCCVAFQACCCRGTCGLLGGGHVRPAAECEVFILLQWADKACCRRRLGAHLQPPCD